MFTRKKKNKKKKIIIGIISVVLFLILGILLYAYSFISKINKVELDKSNLNISSKAEVLGNTVRNIALFGVYGEKDKVNSNIIMILTLDEGRGKIKLTSIKGNSYVNIPSKGMEKISYAYEYGGPELTVKTINENFGLNINQFLSIDFNALKSVIDNLGGVQIKITENEVKHISDISSSGVKNLTGKQAFEYVEIKYEDGEVSDKTQRQRTMIEALYEIYRYTSVTKYPKVVKDFLPYVTTNIPLSEIISIAKDISTNANSGIKQVRFPRDGEEEFIEDNNVDYIKYDLGKAKNDMQSYLFEDKRAEYKK